MHTRLAPAALEPAGRLRALAEGLLVPLGLLGGSLAGSPGIRTRLALARLAAAGLLQGRLSAARAHELIVRPLDSVRHFELEFCRDRIGERSFASYLDLSSPRLAPLLLLAEAAQVRATLCNPDRQDLERTRLLAGELGLEAGIEFLAAAAGDPALGERRFDLVTCISVLEHIAGDDVGALRWLWERVAPRGRLVLTVPCAAQAFEEYLDFNEFGLPVPRDGDFHFSQRFYDRALLEQRVFAVAGAPAALEFFGERRPGAFFADRARRLGDRYYPHWREPIMMGREYARFGSSDDLPGIGVAAMLFEKR